MKIAGLLTKQMGSVLLSSCFFVAAGLNHFINPDFYLPLIPPLFTYPAVINIVSGALEIMLGLGLLHTNLRSLAIKGLIVLLVLFIPSHVYFIQIGACVLDGLCVPMWVAYLRLLLIHPLLIFWVLKLSKR